MRAHRISVTIPEDRRIELVLPADATPGVAEVIVLTRDGDEPVNLPIPGTPSALLAVDAAIEAWRGSHVAQLLSRDVLAADLAYERAAWDERP